MVSVSGDVTSACIKTACCLSTRYVTYTALGTCI